MSGYRQIITEVVALIEEMCQPLTIRELSETLRIDGAEIRRQVMAYNVEPHADLIGHVPQLFIEPVDDEGDEAAGSDSSQDLVHVGDRFGAEVLGTERLGAAVLAPLYEAAADLAAREPDNEVLAGAAQTLLQQFLPGLRPASRFKAEAIADLARAIGAQHQVRIEYSRAWEPGVYTRVIDPYALVRTPRGVEVDAGPVQPDGSIRTYLVSRIRSVTTLDELFERPADADAIAAANRRMTRVTGTAPAGRLWAMRRFADRFEELDAGPDGTRFQADYLPPVPWRVGLALLVAGPGVQLDEARYHGEATTLARRLLAHHGLEPVEPV